MGKRRSRLHRDVTKTTQKKQAYNIGKDDTSAAQKTDKTRQHVRFRKMGRGSWYIIHNQLHNWSTGGRRGETTTNIELRNMFISDLVALVPECTPRPPTRVHDGGAANDQELREYSLFAQYVARIEQMSREPQEGHTEYKPLLRLDFEKLSRRRQVLKLQCTDMLVDNGEEATKFYIKTDEKIYPSTHFDTKVPTITPRLLPTADLLFHQYRLEDKIRRLYQRLRD